MPEFVTRLNEFGDRDKDVAVPAGNNSDVVVVDIGLLLSPTVADVAAISCWGV